MAGRWTFASSVNDVCADDVVGGVHRHWLTQYVQNGKKMTLSCTTWFLSVAWLMISPRELQKGAGVCEMWWCWYVCVKYVFKFKTPELCLGPGMCVLCIK